MASQEVEQWVAEFITRDRLKRDERNAKEAWEASLPSVSYMQTSPTPQEMVGFYESDPLKQATAHGIDPFAWSISQGEGPELSTGIIQKTDKSLFTNAFENLYFGERGDLPMNFLLQLTPQELEAFGPGGQYEGLAGDIEQAQANMSEAVRRNEEVETKFKLAEQQWESNDSFQDMALRGAGGFGLLTGSSLADRARDRLEGRTFPSEEERRRITLEVWGRADELHEDEIAAFMATWRELMDGIRAGEDVRPLASKGFVGEGAGVAFAGEDLSDKDYRRFFDQEQEWLAEAEVHQKSIRSLGAPLSSYSDEEYEALIAQREQSLRNNLKVNPELTDVLTPGLGIGFVAGSMAAVGTVIEKGVQFAGAVTQAFDWFMGGDVVAGMREESEKRQLEAVAEYEAQTGAPRTEVLAELSASAAHQAMEELEKNEPETHVEYMRMAGGVPEVALAFLQADLLDMITPEEQTKYIDEAYEQEEDSLRQMREQDFSVGTEFLNGIATYGRLIPGRGSTWATLLLTDSVMTHSPTAIEGIGDFMHELERQTKLHDYAPSSVLGIDGSLSGLVLDLGGGIAFDPIIWFTGPRLGARTSKPASFAQANTVGNGPVVRQFADDMALASYSPSKGASAMVHISGWLDGTSFGELLNMIKWEPKALPKTPWKTAKNGKQSMEVDTGFLHNLVPDARLADDVSGLADSMKANGVYKPVEVYMSRADDSVWIDDGVKRVLAAERDGGIAQLPMHLNVVDDVPKGVTKIPGYADETVATFQRVMEMESKGGANPEIVEQMIVNAKLAAKQEPPSIAGAPTILKNGEPVRVKFVENQAGGMWWAETADGEIVGVVQAGDVGSGVAVAEGWRQQGVMSAIFDSAHKIGEDLITRLKFEALSPDGQIALQAYAARELAKALPQASDFGTPVASLMKEGDQLGRPYMAVGSGKVTGIRPDAILPRRLLLGEIPWDEVHALAKKAIVERGAMPDGATSSAIARYMTRHVTQLARTNKMGNWIERFMTPMAMAARLDLIGPHSFAKLTDMFFRIWGDDTAKLDIYLERLINAQREVVRKSGESSRRIDALGPEAQRYRQMYDQVNGNVWDDHLKTLEKRADLEGKGQVGKADTGAELADDIPTEPITRAADELAQAKANRDQFRTVVEEADKQLDAKYTLIDRETSVLGYSDDLEKIVIEMYEDYNRTHIATNPLWKKLVDPKTGMVPWNMLKKGRAAAPDLTPAQAQEFFAVTMKDAAKEMGISVEELTAKLSNNQNIKLAMDLPLSPLELTMAKELGAAAYSRFTHIAWVSRAREAAFTFHRAWIIDKVMTPATAATVSADELVRTFLLGGANAGQARWLRDRSLFISARARAATQGKMATFRGTPGMSAKHQERMRVLRDYPVRMKQAERQVYDQTGHGWTDISPGAHDYADAAYRFTAGFLQDSGFRAMLKGEDAFRDWFLSPDGMRLRNGTVVGRRNGRTESMLLTDADEFYRGWKSVFEDLILSDARKAGKFDEVMASWRETAQMIEESGGLAKDIPDIAINYLGDVRGIRREMQGKMGVQSLQESFFDRAFMDPVNYRRGMLAEMTRVHEVSRLTSLFETQGKRIVSDAELESIFGLTGLQGGTRAGLNQAAQEMALKAGYIPKSYIDDLAERVVLKEIENTLYQFDVGSRLGSQARVVFPFGKPWADMAAFWGREVLRQPTFRGVINDKNLLWLRSAADRGYLAPLVPNRASAMISRLAHTDFTIDQGIFGPLFTEEGAGPAIGDPQGVLHSGGVLPGSEQTDFSPLFFLPTGGENPFSVMLPGIGVVPIQFLDLWLKRGIDPVEDAQEYQRRIDEIGQVIPAAHYQQGGAISRFVGGGVVSKSLLGMADIVGMQGNDSLFAMTSALGDIGREIDRNREVSAMLAQPDELELLLSAETPEEAEMLLMALVAQADIQASGNHLVETVVRGMVPVTAVYDTALNEIQDVWFEADALMPESNLIARDPANMNDEDRRQVANDIRTDFFKLEDWQRDALIVQQPSLAVNIVGGWEWVPAAINENYEGTQYSYRSGGTKAELARHETLVRKGLIRPAVPLERARRILGTIRAAKVNTAKALYQSELDTVNDAHWEVYVTDESKERVRELLESEFGQAMGLRTMEETWYSWRALEKDFEIWVAEQTGIEAVRGESEKKEDLTVFDYLRKEIQIPNDEKPWGTTFPGLEEEDVKADFNEWIVEPTEKTMELAAALDIQLYEGMTGEELFEELQQEIVQTSPIFSIVQPSYDRYIGDRSISTGENALHMLAQSTEVADEWQDNIKRWLFKNDLMTQRHKLTRRDGLSLADQTEMREEFLYLWLGSKTPPKRDGREQTLDWQGIWDEQYARRYGPLDWTPPPPKSPLDANDELVDGVMLPEVRHVVDGDTLTISEYKGAPTQIPVRLLGIRAAETSGEDRELAFEQTSKLKDALLQAAIDGDRIYLVRDERFGNTDRYGRILAWLWIGDTPFYNPEDLRPHQDPSGGDG